MRKVVQHKVNNENIMVYMSYNSNSRLNMKRVLIT